MPAKKHKYQVFADDVCIWRLQQEPNQEQLNYIAQVATRRGWNGTVLEIKLDGNFLKFVSPEITE